MLTTDCGCFSFQNGQLVSVLYKQTVSVKVNWNPLRVQGFNIWNVVYVGFFLRSCSSAHVSMRPCVLCQRFAPIIIIIIIIAKQQ